MASILDKLLATIRTLLLNSGNIFPGYEVSDGDVESKSGQCAAEYIYHPTVAGNQTDLRVVISATNIKDELSWLSSYISTLDWDAIKNDPETFKSLTGIDISKALMQFKDLEEGAEQKEPDLSGIDISLQSVINSKAGWLGVDLEDKDINPDKIGDWRDLAVDNLKYNLLCETERDDAGKVSNQSLLDCVGWIHKYIDFINKNNSNESNEKTGTDKQLSHEEKVARENDKQSQISSTNETDAIKLVQGILVAIQGELRNEYQDRLNTDLSLDKLIPQPEDNSQSESETTEQGENQQQGQEAENPMENASKHINVTLKKVQASSELEILSLNSNYLPGDTLNDIDEIINQNEFIDTLTEEPQAFDIAVDDDGFDIEKCEECPQCDPCASLCEVFKSGIRAYRNLYIIHWMSKGNDMMKLHILAEEMYGELIQEIDTIGELLVEKQGTVPQLDFPCDYVPVQDYDFQGSLEVIKSLLQVYIDTIDYAYCNQDSDVQSTLDEWLRYWKKQLNYFVERQEV